MDGPHLIYFADPMCSWCYGFSPVVEEIRTAFGAALPIRLVMGGLRPGTDTPMAEAAKSELKGHWTHVHDATGLPFTGGALDADGFVYDTDPAARAVVLVRHADPDAALSYLLALQRAFYAEGLNITRAEVLAELAGAHGVRRDAFLADFETDRLKQATWRDYAISQRAGVQGFPTLVAGPAENGTYGAVTRGYQSADVVLPLLRRWLGG